MGASAAVTRVLVVAMVRDLFEAEAMARVMSLVFMTFMLVPVLAPNIGQLILLFAPWRAIFVVLAVYAADHARSGRGSGCRRRFTRNIRRALAWREIGERDRRDDARAAVARLHAGDDDQLLGAGRLHQLDPADRLRRLPRGPLHRPGVRIDRRADGACLLAQLARRRALRTAAGRAHGRTRRSCW